MNDDFLKQYRKQPDQAFAEAVYGKISVEKRRVSTMKKLVFAFIFFLAILGFTLSVSPRARGAAMEIIRKIGGLRFMETSDYPGDNEKPEIVNGMDVSLEEAANIFPGTISLPTFLPEGYNRDPDVMLFNLQDRSTIPQNVTLTWQKPGGGGSGFWLNMIYLKDENANYTFVVGKDTVEEITINGKPAALIRGGWNDDTKSYDTGTHIQSIHWNYDEHTIYELRSTEPIDPEVLIKIAESIK